MAPHVQTRRFSNFAIFLKRSFLNIRQTTIHHWQNLYEAALICLCCMIGHPIELSWSVGAVIVALGIAVFLAEIYNRQILLRFVRFPYEFSSFLLAIGLCLIGREPIFFSIVLVLSILLFCVQTRRFEAKKLRLDPDYVQYAYLVSMFFPQAWPGGRLSQDYSGDKILPLRRCIVFLIALVLLYARTRWDDRWELRALMLSLSGTYFVWCLGRLVATKK